MTGVGGSHKGFTQSQPAGRASHSTHHSGLNPYSSSSLSGTFNYNHETQLQMQWAAQQQVLEQQKQLIEKLSGRVDELEQRVEANEVAAGRGQSWWKLVKQIAHLVQDAGGLLERWAYDSEQAGKRGQKQGPEEAYWHREEQRQPKEKKSSGGIFGFFTGNNGDKDHIEDSRGPPRKMEVDEDLHSGYRTPRGGGGGGSTLDRRVGVQGHSPRPASTRPRSPPKRPIAVSYENEEMKSHRELIGRLMESMGRRVTENGAGTKEIVLVGQGDSVRMTDTMSNMCDQALSSRSNEDVTCIIMRLTKEKTGTCGNRLGERVVDVLSNVALDHELNEGALNKLKTLLGPEPAGPLDGP